MIARARADPHSSSQAVDENRRITAAARLGRFKGPTLHFPLKEYWPINTGRAMFAVLRLRKNSLILVFKKSQMGESRSRTTDPTVDGRR
jgi:hypothetical protein